MDMFSTVLVLIATEVPTQDLIGNPLPIILGKWRPDLNSQRRQNADEVDRALAILQSEWLPEETSPSESEKHVSSAGIQIVQSESSRFRDGHQDRVNRCRCDPDHQRVDTHTRC